MDDDPLKLDEHLKLGDDPLKQSPVQGNVWLIVGWIVLGHIGGFILLEGDVILGMLLGVGIASLIVWSRHRKRWKG